MNQQMEPVSHPMVTRLLKDDLPKMQKAAMKHAFLTSVANVMRNPIAERTNETGEVFIIGFGNLARTMPMVLIKEPSDGTIRHAMTPNLKNQIELDLVVALQDHEAQWAIDRGERPRPILKELRYLGIDDAGRHGINGYPGGRPPFTKADLDQISSGAFYPTGFLPDSLEINQKGELSLDDATLRRKLTRNVSDSATMAAGVRPGGPKSISVVLQDQKRPAPRGTVSHKRVGWVESDLPSPEDDYQP